MNCKPAVVYNKVNWILNNKKIWFDFLLKGLDPTGDGGFQA